MALPPPKCHLSGGTPARADPYSVQRKLADEATLPTGSARGPRTCLPVLPLAAVRCPVPHCATVAKMLTNSSVHVWGASL